MEELFEFDGKFYLIKRQKYEISRELFLERVWYILTNLNKSELTFDQLQIHSLKWSNEKNLECSY